MVDLVLFLSEENSDVPVWDLMRKFDKLRQKEERLLEVLTLRMQDKKEVTSAIKIQKRTDTQGWHKEVKNSCITDNLIR